MRFTCRLCARASTCAHLLTNLVAHLTYRVCTVLSAVLLYLQAVRTRFQLHKSITPDYYGFTSILLLLLLLLLVAPTDQRLLLSTATACWLCAHASSCTSPSRWSMTAVGMICSC
jgi:hypothetical protein